MGGLQGRRGHPPEEVPDEPAHPAREGQGDLVMHQAPAGKIPGPFVQPPLHLSRELPAGRGLALLPVNASLRACQGGIGCLGE